MAEGAEIRLVSAFQEESAIQAKGSDCGFFLCFGEQYPIQVVVSKYGTIFKSYFDANIIFFHIIPSGL